MASRDDFRVGFFGNLSEDHGFGPCISFLSEKMDGVRVDHVDVHSAPKNVASDFAIDGWLNCLKGIPIQTVWVGFDGEDYNSIVATHEYGLVPTGTRQGRLKILREVIGQAESLNAQAVGLHIGHLTGRDMDGYDNLVNGMRNLADVCTLPGGIVLETGQETADVLREFLSDVNSGNLGINFDPANLILYGSQEPMEAFKQVAKYVRSIHCKDARWTTGTRGLDWGTQVNLGEGEVGGRNGFPNFLRLATELCPYATLTIEYERFKGHGTDEHWDDLRRQFRFMEDAIRNL